MLASSVEHYFDVSAAIYGPVDISFFVRSSGEYRVGLPRLLGSPGILLRSLVLLRHTALHEDTSEAILIIAFLLYDSDYIFLVLSSPFSQVHSPSLRERM